MARDIEVFRRIEEAKAEAEGLEQSLTSDDPKVIRRISEARIEIEVQSRRLTVAQESLPAGLETACQGVLQYYWELIRKADELALTRAGAHAVFFRTRLDIDSFRSALISGGYFMSTNILSTLCENTPDVMAARQCKPRFVWAINARHDGTGLTLGRLQEDVERLSENEAAYEAEAGREYSFEESKVEV